MTFLVILREYLRYSRSTLITQLNWLCHYGVFFFFLFFWKISIILFYFFISVFLFFPFTFIVDTNRDVPSPLPLPTSTHSPPLLPSGCHCGVLLLQSFPTNTEGETCKG